MLPREATRAGELLLFSLNETRLERVRPATEAAMSEAGDANHHWDRSLITELQFDHSMSHTLVMQADVDHQRR